MKKNKNQKTVHMHFSDLSEYFNCCILEFSLANRIKKDLRLSSEKCSGYDFLCSLFRNQVSNPSLPFHRFTVVGEKRNQGDVSNFITVARKINSVHALLKAFSRGKEYLLEMQRTTKLVILTQRYFCPKGGKNTEPSRCSINLY